MQFIIQAHGQPVHVGAEAVVLEADSWDDRGYRTSFDIWYRNPTDLRNLGRAKVAVAGQERGPSPLLPAVYDGPPPVELFSLGQSDIYYDNIRKLGFESRTAILGGLGDLAYDLGRFNVAQAHEVTRESLLRVVEEQTVRVQFNRIARGGVRLSEYRFSYLGPGQDPDSEIVFHVHPEARPSSNVHVLIGRNGVGKTTLLRRLAGAVVTNIHEKYGRVMMSPTSTSPVGERFVNVVSVTFSAFDPFAAMEAFGRPGAPLPPEAVAYTYVGLKSSSERTGGLERTQHDLLCAAFGEAFEQVLQTRRLMSSWRSAMLTLSRDPRFAETSIASYAQDLRAGQKLSRSLTHAMTDAFGKLSSGHAIVVLTLTELVGRVAEQSLVLVDEPETHLHPPLLASFVQALSELLTEFNGVAVIATHSPVVLQTVPRSCVYKLIRHGETSRAERPQIETYGENVGVLTHEVFGLEVMQSGFYNEITEAVARFDSYADVLAHFSGQLGSEAKGLVHVLLADKAHGRS
ncbi:AAA family ATPase [Streptomyces lavendulae]|uniref:AAA family ATPase n=1 Tax=Streptomyces lavendulae TaxID=1914 RepID=UPI003828860F